MATCRQWRPCFCWLINKERTVGVGCAWQDVSLRIVRWWPGLRRTPIIVAAHPASVDDFEHGLVHVAVVRGAEAEVVAVGVFVGGVSDT